MSITVTVLKFLKPLADYLVDPIKNEVNHLCCYSCNVERLNLELPELNVRKESVDQDTKAAEEKLEVIRLEVLSWLTKVEKVQTKSNRIINDAAQAQRSYLSKWLRFLHYSLSKEAKETTKDSIELRNTRFEKIANPINPADLKPLPTTLGSDLAIPSSEELWML